MTWVENNFVRACNRCCRLVYSIILVSKIYQRRPTAADELGVTGLIADQGNLEAVEQLAATVKDRFGRVDILFINAGVTSPTSIEEATEEAFDREFVKVVFVIKNFYYGKLFYYIEVYNLSQYNLMKSVESRPKNIFVSMLFPLNSKNVLYLFLAVLFVSVFVFTEWPLVSINDAAHKRLVSMSWLLVPHILFALTALVTGPFQFSTKLREYNKALHRMLGKIYIVSVVAGAVFAFFISQKFPFPGSTFLSEAATVTQAGIWFFTTLMAYVFARKRQIALHKTWMSRSYGITLIFIFARALNPFRAYFNINADGFGVLLFLLIIFALVVPEILLNINELSSETDKDRANVHRRAKST